MTGAPRCFLDANVLVSTWATDVFLTLAEEGLVEPRWSRAVLGEAKRAFLFCGTGMGMSMIANRFKGVRAAVVESVFAAKMCRAINDANVLCMGQMIWGDMMAEAAADAFLDTKFTEGLEPLAKFLEDARTKVEAIRD